MAARGATPLPWRDIVPIFTSAIADLAGQGFRGPFAPADGRVIHDAGGSEAQELAYVLAVAVAYLRVLEASGIALDDARRMVFFRLAADADQFLTLAKFRALRKLWARVEEACGLPPGPAFVAADTAWRMMTRRDPWVNLLRTTMAVFAAGLGGANSITVLPFTAARGLPDRFARRLARNTQLILLEESNLAKVADPAAGAGGIEDLTDQLCGAAWALFQEIEAAGGAAAALEGGLIQRKVAAVRARARGRGRAAQGCAHRHERVSRHPRDAGRGARDGADPAVTLLGRHHVRRRCRRSALPSRSSGCAMPPMRTWQTSARGQRYSLPISASRPTSRRARPSPRTFSRPAASRR